MITGLTKRGQKLSAEIVFTEEAEEAIKHFVGPGWGFLITFAGITQGEPKVPGILPKKGLKGLGQKVKPDGLNPVSKNMVVIPFWKPRIALVGTFHT